MKLADRQLETPVGPACACGHNARWHGAGGACLAVLCPCQNYWLERELAARLQDAELRGAA